MKASMIFRRLASFLGFSSDVVARDLLAEVGRDLLEIELLQDLADRFGADHGGEAVLAVLVLGAQVLVLGEELTLLQRRQAGLDDDVGFSK